MNKAILMGRLVRDPELRQTQSNVAVCTFTLAVDRRFKNANGERQADFIPVVAWRQTAEFVARYFQQGSKILIVGSIQRRSWEDNEGRKRYETEVIAEEAHFCESRRSEGAPHESRPYQGGGQGTMGYGTSSEAQKPTYPAQPTAPAFGGDQFTPAGEDDETDLPFDL